MRRLSAVDAIGPAWDHTQSLLLAPRSWRLALKIGAVACFAQMGGCNSNFNFPKNGMNGHSHLGQAYVAALFLIGIFALAVGLALFYIGSRLQFVLFEIVVTRHTRVSPIWARYGAATWRWIGLKVLFFVAVLICSLPLLVPAIFYFVRTLGHAKLAGNAGFSSYFAAFSFLLVAAIVWILLVTCCYSLIADFGLPSMALEGTPLRETVRRVFALIRTETGAVALYLIMRLLLALAGVIGCYLALLLIALILAIPLGGIGFGTWMVWQHAQGAAYILMIAGWFVLGTIFAVLLLMAAITLFGAVLTFIQAYGIYFLGGRYPLLGNLLEPGPGYPFTPPPIFPSAEERKDDDGGPPMPMNPAVA